MSLGVFGEGLLLGVAPVLVEAAENVLVEVLSPDGLESAETTRSVDVADQTDNLHGGAFDNGGSVNNVLLDNLLTFTTLEVLNAVGHTSLEAHEGSEVNGFGAVITGEVTDTAAVVAGTALGDETEATGTGGLELTVRHSK